MNRLTDAGSSLGLRVVRIAQTAFSDQRSLYMRALSGFYERRPTWISSSDPKTLSATVIF